MIRHKAIIIGLAMGMPLWPALQARAQQLDPTWTLTVNGQSVRPEPDGTFRIPNIAAADQFGASGPGSTPDFLSDDFLQLVGTGLVAGQTMWVFSEYFQIGQDDAYRISDLTFTLTEPLSPVSIEIAANPTVLAVGQMTQLTVTAALTDGSMQDVTARSSWTVYRTSNTALASVSEDGLVSANGVGVAYLTAVNNGATAVKRIDIVESTVHTTLEGYVLLQDGSPAPGLDVNTSFDGTAMTDSNGYFSVKLVAPEGASASATARTTISDQMYLGISETVLVVADGVTDLGIITLTPLRNGPPYGNPQFAVGDYPMAVAVADFDADGDMDAAIVNRGSNTVTIMTNDGKAAFTNTAVNVGTRPQWVACGLVNADAAVDLVVANGMTNDASVLINAGNGTFMPAVSYAAGTGPRGVTLGDVDKDLDLDMVVANETSDDVSVLLNNGDGTFAAAAAYPAGNGPRSVALGDINADLDLDLAVVNASDLNVGIMLNNGDGTFAAQTTYGAGGLNVTPRAVAFAQLDADGDLDMVVTRGGFLFSASSVAVFHNNGTGTFASSVNYAAGGDPETLIIEDLDGDLDIDLLVNSAVRSDVSVFLNNGAGAFAAEVRYNAGNGARAVSYADFDGDGVKDAITANAPVDTVSLLMGIAGGSFEQDYRYGTGDQPYSVGSGDINGDGKIDLVVANLNTDNVSVLLGNGDGTYQDDVLYPAGDAPRAVTVADFDGDHDADVAVANLAADTISILFNDNGALGSPVAYVAGDGPGSIAVADVNDDSALDLVVGNDTFDTPEVSVFVNNGDGTFAARVAYTLSAGSLGVAVDDLNGDLEEDIASVNHSNVSILLSNGDGTFAAPVSYTLTGSTNVRSIAIGDLDGDGDVDLVCADINAIAAIFLNNGGGAFVSGGTFGPDVSFNARSLVVGDIDLDGDLDIMGEDAANDNVVALFNNGAASFAPVVRFGAGDEPRAVHLADLDGDGDLDLTVANRASDNVSVLLNRKR